MAANGDSSQQQQEGSTKQQQRSSLSCRGGFRPAAYILFVIGTVCLYVAWYDVRDVRTAETTKRVVNVPPMLPHHQQNKIVVNVGMPRCGTLSFMQFMKSLFPDGGEFHHQFGDFTPDELTEYLVLGNRSASDNRIFKKLTDAPNNRGKVRAMADHPAFLLAPMAMDFPDVYWVHVTRDTEVHIDSTLYMFQRWCQDRCQCPEAPKCTRGNMAIMDRLYFNRYNVLGHMCNNNGNASAIPRDLVRKLVETHEEETRRYLKDHPRYLHYHLEDDDNIKIQKLATFLGLPEGSSVNTSDASFRSNARIDMSKNNIDNW